MRTTVFAPPTPQESPVLPGMRRPENLPTSRPRDQEVPGLGWPGLACVSNGPKRPRPEGICNQFGRGGHLWLMAKWPALEFQGRQVPCRPQPVAGPELRIDNREASLPGVCCRSRKSHGNLVWAFLPLPMTEASEPVLKPQRMPRQAFPCVPFGFWGAPLRLRKWHGRGPSCWRRAGCLSR